MRNIKVNISVGFSETEEPVTEKDNVEKMDDGSFRLVLDYQDEFNIDRLENALLQISYPALRAALSEHLEQASKKKLTKNPS
jgi:PHD/YefM family antitoxin component YafN of YafNO toxin-antitoxin module